jgi:hypothetical protein
MIAREASSILDKYLEMGDGDGEGSPNIQAGVLAFLAQSVVAEK